MSRGRVEIMCICCFKFFEIIYTQVDTYGLVQSGDWVWVKVLNKKSFQPMVVRSQGLVCNIVLTFCRISGLQGGGTTTIYCIRVRMGNILLQQLDLGEKIGRASCRAR